jgi:hypothetical protein
MANWSNTSIVITGDEHRIYEAKKVLNKFIFECDYSRWLDFDEENKEEIYSVFPEFKEYIESLDEISFRAGFSTMEINVIDFFSDKIIIYASGRWCSPSIFFKLLAQKFKLDMEYFDAEEGVGFSYYIRVNFGEITEEWEKDYYCKELIKYIYGDVIEGFLDNIEWYFSPEQEKIPAIENLLKELSINEENKKIIEEYRETA